MRGTSVVVQYATTGTVDAGQLMIDTATGMAIGAFGGSSIGLWGNAIANAAVSFSGSIINDVISDRDIDWVSASLSGAIGFGFGILSGPGAQYDNATLKNKIAIKKAKKAKGKRTVCIDKDVTNELNLLKARAYKRLRFSVENLYTFALEYPILSLLNIFSALRND